MALPKMTVEVAYAKPERQCIIPLQVEITCTIQAAIEQSGILKIFPEIDLANVDVGVFSKRRKLTDGLQAGDRIEIYRPLLIDPKEARRKRAKKK